MRKTILFTLLLSILLLSGCFGLFKKKEPQKPVAGEQPTTTATSQEAQNGQAMIPEPPSFQDGDYYIQALTARSQDLCGKIKNEKLQLKCKTDVQAAGQES